jgi:gliding-associated putative ABC transporter substrate-binding component GldG
MLFFFARSMKNRIKPFIGPLLIAIGFLLVMLSPYIRLRFDLSEEKKFTIAASSIELLRQQDAPIRIKVFLGGNKLPAGFKRMEKALDELLLDLKSNSSQGIEIEKIDVYKEYPDESTRQKIIFELDSLGIPPTNVVNNEDGKQVQQLVFPGVLIEKGDAQIGVLLLKGNKLSSPQEMLNQSVEGMEYEIMQGIAAISETERKKIGFFLDYSHVPAIKQIDLISSLKKRYDLYPVDLAASPTLDGLDAICVIQPDRKFSEADQYKIDQFLVKGGKAIFLLDGIRVDTVANQGLVVTPIDLGLQNLLFRYGIRLNSDLVKDAQLSGTIPLAVGNFGNKPSIELMPWPAFPLLQGNPSSVITRNLDAVYGHFVSSLDSVKGASYLQKTALLKTSPYTQVQQAPATLPFSASGKEFDPKNYVSGSRVIAYLVEGKFVSAFRNRILPSDSLSKSFVGASGIAGGIVIVGDGDVALNGVDLETKRPWGLGFDPFSKHTYANKDFLLNSFHYLLDDGQAMMARNKTVSLRPLDKVKVKSERVYWQWVNLLIPLGFGIIVSALVIWYRKRKFNA